jgi:hypothetical protein
MGVLTLWRSTHAFLSLALFCGFVVGVVVCGTESTKTTDTTVRPSAMTTVPTTHSGWVSQRMRVT